MESCPDLKYMRMALEQARKSKELGEIPVGAILTDGEGNVLAETHNLCETNKSPLAHAEILAIDLAFKKLNRKWLNDCTLYVTLEPCPMCTGALIHARIGRVVYGARDPRAGACGTLIDLPSYPLEAHPLITNGVLAEESLSILRAFFENKRKQK